MNCGHDNKLGSAHHAPMYSALKNEILSIDWAITGNYLGKSMDPIFKGVKIIVPEIGMNTVQDPSYKWIPPSENLALFSNWVISRYFPKHKLWMIQLSNLPPNGNINLHVDGKRFHHLSHRIHVPIKTNPNVKMWTKSGYHHYEADELWEINNCVPHWVTGDGSGEHRVHMLIDLIGDFIFDGFPGGEKDCLAWLNTQVVDFKNMDIWERT